MMASPFSEHQVLTKIFHRLDFASLWTCSLVCSSWREAALPYVFCNVKIEFWTDEERNVYTFMDMLRANHKTKCIQDGHHIRELRLVGNVGDGYLGPKRIVELSPWHLRYIVEQCPNLHTLVLSRLRLVGPGFESIPDIRPRLDLLKVEECQVYKEGGTEYLHYLLSLFASVTTLDLDISWVSLWGNPAPLPSSQLANNVEDRVLPVSKVPISFVTLRNLPLDWALALSDHLGRMEKPGISSLQEITVWPRAEVVRGLLPWPKGEQHLVNIGAFIDAASVGPEIEALRINTMDYPTMQWLDCEPGTVDYAYLPPRSVRMLELQQCRGVRSLLFSFESEFCGSGDAKFDLAFQAALDIVENVSFPQLERIFFHLDSDGQINHPRWEDMDELLADDKFEGMHSVVIVHSEEADETDFQHLLPTMHERGKVECWPTDIPWWDLEILDEEDESSETASIASSTTLC
ncbi:hypothetical protein V8D89_003571 [Ganoderma adspersum]